MVFALNLGHQPTHCSINSLRKNISWRPLIWLCTCDGFCAQPRASAHCSINSLRKTGKWESSGKDPSNRSTLPGRLGAHVLSGRSSPPLAAGAGAAAAAEAAEAAAGTAGTAGIAGQLPAIEGLAVTWFAHAASKLGSGPQHVWLPVGFGS